MSAQFIFDLAPLGSIIRYFDDMPRPPEHHRKGLAEWLRRNNSGYLVRKHAEARIGDTALAASITLHKRDFGGNGATTIQVHETFSVSSKLRFVVNQRPPLGAVRVLQRLCGDPELLHLAACRADAEAWLKEHGHPHAVLEEVTADEIAAAAVEGRAAA